MIPVTHPAKVSPPAVNKLINASAAFEMNSISTLLKTFANSHLP
jgi:hypothetical protein